MSTLIFESKVAEYAKRLRNSTNRYTEAIKIGNEINNLKDSQTEKYLSLEDKREIVKAIKNSLNKDISGNTVYQKSIDEFLQFITLINQQLSSEDE